MIHRRGELDIQECKSRLGYYERKVYKTLGSLKCLSTKLQGHQQLREAELLELDIDQTDMTYESVQEAKTGAKVLVQAWGGANTMLPNDVTELLATLNEVTLALQTQSLEIGKNKMLRWWKKELKEWQHKLDNLCSAASIEMHKSRKITKQTILAESRDDSREQMQHLEPDMESILDIVTDRAPDVVKKAPNMVKPQKLPESWKSEYPSLGIRLVDSTETTCQDPIISSPSLNEWQNYLRAKLHMNKQQQLGLLSLARAKVILGPPTPRSQ